MTIPCAMIGLQWIWKVCWYRLDKIVTYASKVNDVPSIWDFRKWMSDSISEVVIFYITQRPRKVKLHKPRVEK